MATAIGKKPSTVMSWKARGGIPDTHKPDVLKVASGLGLGLTKEDFFPSDDNQHVEDAA